MEVYRFGQCLGKRFSPPSTFFSLVSSRAFRDASHSRFRCGNPNQCLPNFLKMLLLVLPQIYTGGAVASWLVRSSPDRAVRVRALAGDIVLCSWARHFTITVPLSAQVCKWVPTNLMLGVTLLWTSMHAGASRNTPSRFMLSCLPV